MRYVCGTYCRTASQGWLLHIQVACQPHRLIGMYHKLKPQTATCPQHKPKQTATALLTENCSAQRSQSTPTDAPCKASACSCPAGTTTNMQAAASLGVAAHSAAAPLALARRLPQLMPQRLSCALSTRRMQQTQQRCASHRAGSHSAQHLRSATASASKHAARHAATKEPSQEHSFNRMVIQIPVVVACTKAQSVCVGANTH
ncbi:hypothetical protein COO60DRAFT_1521760 [Scenedesmus sp. NREL 46B-D3]|nr:hypothetical protein COO60DRAFT_1521760 [Scenedesmus sp. NREL 46B-D3]